MTDAAHLTSDEVAAYIDNTLSEADCARVKAHLAECAACRKEIVSVSRLVAGAPRSKRRFVAFSAIAAAAAVTVIFIARPARDSDIAKSERLRGSRNVATAEGVAVVRAIGPIGNQASNARIVFVWHPLSRDGAYRLTLTDDQGAKVWLAATNDTTIPLPQNLSLVSRRNYYWYVDVLQPDGQSATTGITAFQVVR
jgi:predicted anti-sigma-YlaC factor YlaD